MHVTGYCKDCQSPLSPERGLQKIPCPGCARVYELFPTPSLEKGEVDACLFCGYAHLHVRKDFPRRLGLAIVAVAAVLTFTPITPPGLFFLPLVVASLIDLALYSIIPWKVVCYVCDAEYRGVEPGKDLRPFDLATATERARLRWPKPPASSVPGPQA